MSVKFTERRDGIARVNIRVTYFIPEPLVEFLRESSDINTDAEAIVWIRTHLHEVTDDWKQVAIDDLDTPCLINVDDFEASITDGYTIYDGPGVVWR